MRVADTVFSTGATRLNVQDVALRHGAAVLRAADASLEVRDVDLAVQDDDLEVQDIDLRVRNGDLGVRNGDLGVRNGDLEVQDGALRVLNGTLRREQPDLVGEDPRKGLDLPQLHARWALRVDPQDSAQELLHLRLRVLHQPPVQRRAASRFQTPQEVVRLTLDFYRRNYIEGLFPSSGIIRDADYTMEQLIAVAKSLRTEHKFAGYIHLKTISNAAPAGAA